MQRDVAIDIVKFLAVLMIINSHADMMYPHMKILATGGAIGDCLFLFCSGFTLFWGGAEIVWRLLQAAYQQNLPFGVCGCHIYQLSE